jgi:hypothetical protein
VTSVFLTLRACEKNYTMLFDTVFGDAMKPLGRVFCCCFSALLFEVRTLRDVFILLLAIASLVLFILSRTADSGGGYAQAWYFTSTAWSIVACFPAIIPFRESWTVGRWTLSIPHHRYDFWRHRHRSAALLRVDYQIVRSEKRRRFYATMAKAN